MKKTVMNILGHEEVGYQLRCLTLAGTTGAKPGQFVQVAVSETMDPFLLRPISVHDAGEGQLSLLYRVAGRGTEYLSRKKAGETLALVGPLGNGFPLSEQDAVLVAGGIGAAPLYYLLRTLHANQRKTTFLYGAKTAGELARRESFRALASVYREATDDGSSGYAGMVTDLLEPLLSGGSPVVYACGPEPMLHQVSRLADLHNTPCYVSLEARMACGVGACLGCVIPAAGGQYRRVCADGPVFDAREVFTREA